MILDLSDKIRLSITERPGYEMSDPQHIHMLKREIQEHPDYKWVKEFLEGETIDPRLRTNIKTMGEPQDNPITWDTDYTDNPEGYGHTEVEHTDLSSHLDPYQHYRPIEGPPHPRTIHVPIEDPLPPQNIGWDEKVKHNEIQHDLVPLFPNMRDIMRKMYPRVIRNIFIHSRENPSFDGLKSKTIREKEHKELRNKVDNVIKEFDKQPIFSGHLMNFIRSPHIYDNLRDEIKIRNSNNTADIIPNVEKVWKDIEKYSKNPHLAKRYKDEALFQHALEHVNNPEGTLQAVKDELEFGHRKEMKPFWKKVKELIEHLHSRKGNFTKEEFKNLDLPEEEKEGTMWSKQPKKDEKKKKKEAEKKKHMSNRDLEKLKKEFFKK